VTRSSEAVFQAKSLQEQIVKLKPTGAVADAIKSFNAKVSAVLDGPENAPANGPKAPALSDVNSNAYDLYKGVGQVDAAPTLAQVADTTKTEHDLSTVLTQWDQVIKTDLPAINAQLKQSGLPELNPQQKPENGENQGNEE
jgi:hypothetical protein